MITNLEAWKLYSKYAGAWKPIADEQRTKILAEVLDDNFKFLTPEFEGSIDTLLEDMAGVQKKVPGGFLNRKTCLLTMMLRY